MHAGSIAVTLEFTLLNSGIALIGYYFSAAPIDYIHWARFRIQVSRAIYPGYHVPMGREP